MVFLAAAGSPDPWQIGVVLGLLVVAVILFSSEALSVDITTLLLLVALIASGTLSINQAFSGFSDQIIIILGSIFVLCGALQETGVVEALAGKLLKVAGRSETSLLLVLTAVASALSAFINNTTVTAMLVGPIVAMGRKTGISPSRLLLPVAFASMLGGTCTLIGTSTNIAVSGYISRLDLAPIGLFELTPIGLIIVAVGLAYLLIVGRHLLPRHAVRNLTEGEAVRDYLSEIVVLPGSRLVTQKVFESDLANMGFRILKIQRRPETFAPSPWTRIQAGDVLLVTGNVESLIRVKQTEGIEIKADWKLGDLGAGEEESHIAEALLTPHSLLVGRTLRETNYHRESGLTVLAIYRRGQPLLEKMASIRLEVGDLLLIQGPKERLQTLQQQHELAILSELTGSILKRRKGLYASLLFGGALLLNAVGLVPLAPGLLSAAILAIILGCITAERAYQLIEWRLLILIGGMIAFGTAIDQSGADELLARWILVALQPLGVMAVLAGFFILTVLLTQPMSNAAAALVVLPIALQAARVLGVNERTFAIAILLAASISFIGPFEPSSILVYGPGRYRFIDFVRTGGVLTLILLVIVLLLLPVFWPLAKH